MTLFPYGSISAYANELCPNSSELTDTSCRRKNRKALKKPPETSKTVDAKEDSTHHPSTKISDAAKKAKHALRVSFAPKTKKPSSSLISSPKLALFCGEMMFECNDYFCGEGPEVEDNLAHPSDLQSIVSLHSKDVYELAEVMDVEKCMSQLSTEFRSVSNELRG